MIFILILITSLVLQFFLPWWIIAPIAFGFAFWKSEKAWKAFGAGFWAIFFLWVSLALIKTLPNENMLANRVAQMFMLPKLTFNWLIMLLLTGLIGGVVAGFAAVTGFYFRRLLVNRKSDL